MGSLRDRIGQPISETELTARFISEGWTPEHAKGHAAYIKLKEEEFLTPEEMDRAREHYEAERAYWREMELIHQDEEELFFPGL